MKMNFIAQAVGGSAPFSTLRRNLKTGRSLCVSGLSAVCKADVIFTLIRENGGQALCIAADEKEAQTLCNDLSQRPQLHGLARICLSRPRLQFP